MTGGSLVAANRITIGNDVNIGANSTVIDTDFHPLDPIERREKPQSSETAPIVIDDDVFIGMNCIILKGVTIGQNSVIGAGSVVYKSHVPPDVIVAGNPAKIIRSFEIIRSSANMHILIVNMHILIVTPYYAPDIGPSAPLFTLLSSELVRRGNQVTVVSAIPHFASGKTGTISKKWIITNFESGVHVIRIRVPSLISQILLNRLLQFISFQIGSTFLS